MKLDLSQLGFQSSGESWYATVGQNQVSLIAIGGKFSRPGQLCRLLCIRANCMRNTEEVVPKGFVNNPFDYPVKMEPKEIISFDQKSWRYASRLLNYPYGYLASQKDCDKLVKAIETRILPWARDLDQVSWIHEIQTQGERGWIENLWIEDLTTKALNRTS